MSHCHDKGQGQWQRERKMNKGISCMILVYTIHQPLVHVCTNFQLCRLHSSREKCDENFYLKALRNDRMMEGQTIIAPFFKAKALQPRHK